MNLTNAIIRDLVSDIRGSKRALDAAIWHDQWPRSEEVVYERQCRLQVTALFKHRHTAKLNRYGWPILTEFGVMGK